MWRYGAGLFIEELAGAINRINYNQHNEQLNALAGEACCVVGGFACEERTAG
jgi:hypothetical protein